MTGEAKAEGKGKRKANKVAFHPDVVDVERPSKRKAIPQSAIPGPEDDDDEDGEGRDMFAEELDPDLDNGEEEDADDDDGDDEDDDEEDGGKDKGDGAPEDRITEVEGEEEDYVPETGFGKDEVPIEPFNLKREQEEGYFDKDGSYVAHKDSEAAEGDAWLVDVAVVSPAVAKAHAAMWDVQTGGKAEDTVDHAALQETIIGLLEPNETVVRALRRYKGANGPKAANKNKSKQMMAKLGGKPAEATPEEKTKAAADMASFLKLTDCADKLLSLGHYNIYEETADSLRPKLGKGAVVGSEENRGAASSAAPASSATPGIKWEYKWTKDAVEVHGPFTSTEMRSWNEQGFFKETECVVRHASSTLPFAPIDKVVFRGP